MDAGLWYFRTGARRKFYFWFFMVFLLLIIGLPLYLLCNILGTPCYMIATFANICRPRRTNRRRWLTICYVSFACVIYYIFVPYVLLVITLPNIFFLLIEKLVELKDLCKNRCRFYNEVTTDPVRRRYMRKIRVWMG